MTGLTSCPCCSGTSVAIVYQPVWTPRTPGFRGHARNFRQSLLHEPSWACPDCGLVFRPPVPDGLNGGIEAQRVVDDSFERAFLAEQAERMTRDSGLYDWLEAHGAFQSVLDVGCGVAPLVRAFAERGRRAVGIDPCSEEADCARRLCGLQVETEVYVGRRIWGALAGAI